MAKFIRGVNPTFRAAPNNSALIDVIMHIIGMKQAYHGMILRTQSHAQKYAQSHAQKYAVARSRTRSRTQSLQAARLYAQMHTWQSIRTAGILCANYERILTYVQWRVYWLQIGINVEFNVG